jgi:hypothetical protein
MNAIICLSSPMRKWRGLGVWLWFWIYMFFRFFPISNRPLSYGQAYYSLTSGLTSSATGGAIGAGIFIFTPKLFRLF